MFRRLLHQQLAESALLGKFPASLTSGRLLLHGGLVVMLHQLLLILLGDPLLVALE